VPELGAVGKPEDAFAGCGEGLRILLSERAGAAGLKRVLGGAVDAGELGNTEESKARPRFEGETWGTRENRRQDPGSQTEPGAPAGLAQHAAPLQKSVAMGIGPEGGWTDAELEAARKAGFQEASLGGLILRAETAVVAALAAVNYELS